MTEVVLSIAKLAEYVKNNELGKLREELSKSESITLRIYRFPRFKLRIRNTRRELVELDNGVFNRLEYALLKSFIEAVKSNKLPVFKDIADLASDYKAAAKYITTLADMGYIIFPDPGKARFLTEASKALSESRYSRRISRALDLPIVLNTELLEKSAGVIKCSYRGGRLVCTHLSHGDNREQEKIQVECINEYLQGG